MQTILEVKSRQINDRCEHLIGWADQTVRQARQQSFRPVSHEPLIPMRFSGCLARPHLPEFVDFLLSQIHGQRQGQRALKGIKFAGRLSTSLDRNVSKNIRGILKDLESCLAGLTSFPVLFETIDITSMVLDWLHTMPPPATADPDPRMAECGRLFGDQSLQVLEAVFTQATNAEFAVATRPSQLSPAMKELLAAVSQQEWQAAFGTDQVGPAKVRFERRILVREMLVDRLPTSLIKDVETVGRALPQRMRAAGVAKELVKSVRTVLQAGQEIARPMAMLSPALRDQGHGRAADLVEELAKLLS